MPRCCVCPLKVTRQAVVEQQAGPLHERGPADQIGHHILDGAALSFAGVEPSPLRWRNVRSPSSRSGLTRLSTVGAYVWLAVACAGGLPSALEGLDGCSLATVHWRSRTWHQHGTVTASTAIAERRLCTGRMLTRRGCPQIDHVPTGSSDRGMRRRTSRSASEVHVGTQQLRHRLTDARVREDVRARHGDVIARRFEQSGGECLDRMG